MLQTILSWFRRPEPEPPAVTFARQTGQVLEWWLIGFGGAGTTLATDVRTLEVALGLHGKEPTVRHAAAWLANVLVGDLVLNRPERVRDEVLAYIGEPDVNRQLLTMRSSAVIMLPDTLLGFATDDPGVTAALRPKMHANVLERIDAPGLSPEGHALFAAVRHLWERALVSVQLEGTDDMRRMFRRLLDETMYALAGLDADARHARHLSVAFEEATNPTGVGKAADS